MPDETLGGRCEGHRARGPRPVQRPAPPSQQPDRRLPRSLHHRGDADHRTQGLRQDAAAQGQAPVDAPALRHDAPRARPGRQAERQPGPDEPPRVRQRARDRGLLEGAVVDRADAGGREASGRLPDALRSAREGGAQRAAAQRLRPVHQPAGPAARPVFRGVQGLRRAPAAGVPPHPQLDRHVRRQHRRVFRGLPRVATWSTARSSARSIAATGTSRRWASRSRRATCMRSTTTSRSSPRSARRCSSAPSWATRWACSSPARRSTCTTRARI